VGTRDPSLFGNLLPFSQNLHPLSAISHLCCKRRRRAAGFLPSGCHSAAPGKAPCPAKEDGGAPAWTSVPTGAVSMAHELARERAPEQQLSAWASAKTQSALLCAGSWMLRDVLEVEGSRALITTHKSLPGDSQGECWLQ